MKYEDNILYFTLLIKNVVVHSDDRKLIYDRSNFKLGIRYSWFINDEVLSGQMTFTLKLVANTYLNLSQHLNI